jgi:putative nucleotidyltransferase with HDIG domain
MKVKLPRAVKNILDVFEKEKYEIYIVGGAVRDILTKKLVYDWDFTTNAKPEEIQKLFPDSFYDNEFGTVGIPPDKVESSETLSEDGHHTVPVEVEGRRPFEITTFRTEHGYSDARRPDKVVWGKTLEEDLQRRDLTINAMALKIRSTKSETRNKSQISNLKSQTATTTDVDLIDLFNGQSDLKNKLVRAVGNPNKRFSEDALRMMRAVRIAAELGFKIEEKTLSAIKKNANLINKIAVERIKDELIKILASPHPYQGMILFRKAGLLQVILPEFEQTFGVEQKSPGRHHIYDVGTHCMFSLKHVAVRSQDPIVRLATLIHDIGKPQTRKVLENGVVTFYNHEIVSARIAKRIATRLRFSRKQTERLYLLVRFHQFTVNEKQTDSAIRRFIRKVGLENVTDMLDLRVGDRLGGGARETSWRLEEFKARLIEVQKQPFTVHDLKISGHDVMEKLSIKPGPKVGDILQKLFDEVVEKKVPNEKEALMEKLTSDFSKPSN